MFTVFIAGLPSEAVEVAESLKGLPVRLHALPAWNPDMKEREHQFARVLSEITHSNLLVLLLTNPPCPHPDLTWLMGYAHGIGLSAIGVVGHHDISEFCTTPILSALLLCGKDKVASVVKEISRFRGSPEEYASFLYRLRGKFGRSPNDNN